MSAAFLQSELHEIEVQDYDRDLAQKKLQEAVELISSVEQVPLPLAHHFSPGVYMREIFMPKGAFVIGHEHKTQHLNVILSGAARVMIEGSIYDIQAPYIFESGPGVQKVLYIEEDMRWATVHVNPDEERDIVKLEERLLNLSPETLQAKGNLSVDEYRMTINKGKELEQ
jgi:quercetin dioxygenase-like cupin family protein